MALLPDNTPVVTGDWEDSGKPQRCLRLHQMTFAITETHTDTPTTCIMVVQQTFDERQDTESTQLKNTLPHWKPILIFGH